MKKYLLILFALLGTSAIVSAQGSKYVNYERDNGWNIGFNMGATWQPREGIIGSNEVTKPYAGFGGGMTLGKSIYEKEGSFFAVDLRGRYLGSYNAGWSGVPDYDVKLTGDTTGASFGFRNYSMKLHEFSLEGVLTLNKLRERTGIILYGFGGIGATLNKVDADYRDFTGSYNDYWTIDTSMNAQDIAAELKKDSDHEFETSLSQTRFSLVPSLGLGFGYQIGPSFSMGVEYKVAYDINGDEFDGGEANGLKDDIMDKYYYTGAFFRWNILSGGPSYTVNPTPPDPWTPTPTTPTTVVPTTPTETHNKPLVNIYHPSTNNTVVHNTSYTIKAKIYHVETQSGVKFTQNGLNNSSFTFNPSTNEFTAQVYLYPGSNVFEITGTNPYGSDQDSRIIILEQEAQQLPPPIVTFTNPAQDGMTVNQSQFTLVSNVLNVDSKNNIGFNFNGLKTTNFTYNTSSKVLTSVVTLKPGINTFTVKGTNTVGVDEKTITVNYEKPVSVQPPVVNITTPATSPYSTSSPVEIVQGTVHYVNSAADINVLVNGNPVTNFTYSTLSKSISFSANLIIGANVVQITGTNQFGSDAATTTIVYAPSEVMNPPIVEFIVPNTSPYPSPANNVTLKATVLNVRLKQNIDVTVNGSKTRAFTYSPITKEVTFNVNLINGNNVFTVTGTNSAGTDMAEQIIIHKLVEQMPPVVSITNPSTNPYNTTVGSQIINAQILHVDNVSGVTAKFNGQSISNFTFDPITDKFVYNATLIPGANVLEVTGTNNVGTASKSQTIIYTEPVVECNLPEINLTQPKVPNKVANGSSSNSLTINTTNSKGAILGKISNYTSIEFKINGVSSPGYNFNNNTGDFETFLHLEEGANNYQLSATNACGTVTTSVTYIYTPEEIPCDNPVIQWATPSVSPYDYTGPSIMTLSASILGVNSSSKVSVKINGQLNKFVFDANTGNLAVGANLKEGVNNVVVSATNDCGTNTSNITINYIKPIAPPTVTITNPAQDPFATFNGSLTVSATVTGVDSKNQIQVFQNGQIVGNFGYNNSSKQVNIPLNLALGSHHIKVQATNPAGSAMDETEIVVNEKCETPAVVISQPTSGSGSTLSFNTSNGNSNIVATIDHANNVMLEVNGQGSNAYNFNPTTGQFSSTVSLNEGLNTYKIIAINNCGEKVSNVINITYTPTPVECNEPVITFTNPSANPYTSSKAKGVSVTAKVMEVTAGNQVVCTVNGTTVQSTFSAASNSVSFTTDLLEGNNVVVITATNSCGSTTAQTTIVFDKPTPKPEVEITTPSQDPFTTSSSVVQVNATVLNVSGQSAIVMTVDGNPTSNFTYSYTSKVLTSNLALSDGSHTVVIKGTNSAGSAQDQTVIEVQKPVTPPDVAIGNVTGTTSSNPYVSPTCTEMTIMGVVLNAKPSEITYTVDGLQASGVKATALSVTKVQFYIPVNFVQPGQVVTVKITANTADGTDSETVYVTCSGQDDTEPDPQTDPETSPDSDPNTNPAGTPERNNPGNTGGGHDNNGHGNNEDGVDSSNPGQGGGGPNGQTDPSGTVDDEGGNGTGGGADPGNTGGGNTNDGSNGNGNSNGNNGHGNNEDGVDVSNPGQGSGGPNGQTDASGSVDDEGGNGSGNNGGSNGNSGNGNGNGGHSQMNTGTSGNDIKKNQEYNSYIGKADKFYSSNMYDEAYNYYQKASYLKPSETYPKTKMAAIEEIKQQLELDAAYDAKIKKADLYFKAGKFSSARTYYTQALSVKPNATYPKNKIAEIDQKLKESEKVTTPVVKPSHPVVKPTNTGGKTGGTKSVNTGGGSKTTTTPKVNHSEKEGTKTTITPNNTTPKTTPTSVTPKKIGGGR